MTTPAMANIIKRTRDPIPRTSGHNKKPAMAIIEKSAVIKNPTRKFSEFPYCHLINVI